jgi:ATP-binding cassette subfamily G (WHITE) protein 2 (SNQ2)
MPSSGITTRPSHIRSPTTQPPDYTDGETLPRVQTSQEAEDAIAELHRVLTREPLHQYPEAHRALDSFLQKENETLVESGITPARLGVLFKDLTTWGAGSTHAPVKTLKDALWRTLTGQDIYEWTVGRLRSKSKREQGRPLIRDFQGVARGGEIML